MSGRPKEPGGFIFGTVLILRAGKWHLFPMGVSDVLHLICQSMEELFLGNIKKINKGTK